MIKFFRLSFAVGCIGMITNIPGTKASVNSTMVVPFSTEIPPITATRTTVRSSLTVSPTSQGTKDGGGSNELVWIIPAVVAAILIALGILICLLLKLRRNRKRQPKTPKNASWANFDKASLNHGISIGEINSSSDIGVVTEIKDIEKFKEGAYDEEDFVLPDLRSVSPAISSREISLEASRKTLSLPKEILHHCGSTVSKKGVLSNASSLATEAKNPNQPVSKLEHIQSKYTHISKDDEKKYSSLPIMRDRNRRELPLRRGARQNFAYRNESVGRNKEHGRPASGDSGYLTITSSERSSCVISETDENEFLEQSYSPTSNKDEILFPKEKHLNQPGRYDKIVEEDDHKPAYKSSKPRSQTVSTSSRRIKKTITPDGDVMKLDEAVLRIGAGCLADVTEITMINDRENSDFKSLMDLDFISDTPSIFEFLPDGLKFLKPAVLTIRLKRIASDFELCILRGSYDYNYQKVIWELVASGIDDNTTNGVISLKIDGFSIYTFFSAMRGLISRILSHLNYSFTCFAYAYYRRQPPMDKIDIAVVLVSEFVEEYGEKDIKQLKDHLKEGYVRSDKGLGKRVQTDRRLQIILDFPGREFNPFFFEIDQPQLDSIGYVIDHFKGVLIESSASGNVKIGNEDSDINSEFLWNLKIHEKEKKTDENALPEEPDDKPKVVYRETKFTRVEITRMSRMVAMDWDSLAGLFDIPYEEREEIRTNYMKYPDSRSKAEEVLKHFNGSDCFGRDVFGKCVDELGRHDLINKLHPMEKEDCEVSAHVLKEVETELLQTNETEEIQESPTQLEIPPEENVQPLSPREMSRLSRHIAVDWDSLAGLMDIAKEERDDIRCNIGIYSDNRSRAEKILSIFNCRKNFSRKKLVECLKEIKKLDVIRPIITGEWKVL